MPTCWRGSTLCDAVAIRFLAYFQPVMEELLANPEPGGCWLLPVSLNNSSWLLHDSDIDKANCPSGVKSNRKMRISKLTSGERLRRKGQTEAPIQRGTSIANLIVMGASAGGYHALQEILLNLPIDIPAAIVVLVHTQLGSEYRLGGLLKQFTRIPIVPVLSSEPLQHQAIFVLPPGKSANFHDGMIIVGDETAPVQPTTTINRLFTAAAQAYRERVIGVILSGLLSDGTEGLRAVHEAGGLTIVQDPAEAAFPSMPANAMADLPVTFCLNLSDIGVALELLVRRGTQIETGMAVAVRTLRARTTVLVRLAEQSWRNPGTREFLMKELASLKCDLRSIEDLVKDVPE